MAQEGQGAVADEVHRGLVARHEEQQDGGDQLALGQAIALLLGGDQLAEQIVARPARRSATSGAK